VGHFHISNRDSGNPVFGFRRFEDSPQETGRSARQRRSSRSQRDVQDRQIDSFLSGDFGPPGCAPGLGLSVKTGDVHKYSLMKTIDVHDRAELIKYVIQQKFIAV
jgi:hypothetical protein